MNVKTLVFDMDGTILDERKGLDAVLIDISPKLQAMGMQLIIASGRLTYMTYIYLNELQINHAPIVACNGAFISYRDSVNPIFAATFDYQTITKLVTKAKALGLLFHIFTTKGLIGVEDAGRLAYYNEANDSKETEDQVPIFIGEEYLTPEHLQAAVKFLVVSNHSPAVADFIAYSQALGLEVVSSGDGLTDVTLKGITKGNALEILHQKGIIDLETTMAFGDNYNDISMLQAVKYPIVMANGEEEVKQYAYDICGDNAHNGVGEYLKKVFLEK